MANLKNVIYLSNEDYETLISTGTVTIDGETLTYDENNIYITPDKLASTTENGLMSAEDKVKLDSINTSSLGTVKSVSAGTGLSISGTSTVNPTVNIASGYQLMNSDAQYFSGDKSFDCIYTTRFYPQFIQGSPKIGNSESPQAWGVFNDSSDSQVFTFNTIGYVTGLKSTYGLAIPDTSSYTANKTIATLDDIESNTSLYQSTSVLVGNAVTNINGRVFQNYTATLVTAGGYTFYQILKSGSNPTETEAKEYMRYMTGSYFLPKYNYDFPKQTIFIFADRSIWKPQYSSTDGLRLYRLTTPMALESEIPTNLENGSGTGSAQEIQDGTGGTFDFTGKNPNATALDPSLTGQITYGGVGNYSASFGGKSQASGKRSLSQGTTTVAKGNYSHAEGDNSVSLGADSHAEGYQTVSYGNASHSEGTGTQSIGTNSHSEGSHTEANSPNSHTEGENSKTLTNDANKPTIPAYGQGDSGQEGGGSSSNPQPTPSQNGSGSHAEGIMTNACGNGSHAEGISTWATSYGSHAEGYGSQATNDYAHAEGYNCEASGYGSHATGVHTKAIGNYSFTQGRETEAIKDLSSAFGKGTKANGEDQVAVGRYNNAITDALFVVGKGTDNEHRSNAFEVYNDGHAEVGLMGSTNKSVATKEYVDSKLNLIDTTWANLKNLRDSGQLLPGVFYRITDYTCTTTQSNTSSAGHVFDIIVRADSNNKLNEVASAIQHAGDTYFANNKLESWKLWYCLDNDTDRFTWADSTNGKGVVYRMIDEFDNDIPYDFKNILFTSSEKYTNAYTFSYTEDSIIKDASLLASKNCYSNVIKKYINSNKQQLNFNVFYSTSTNFSCYSNTFGNSCTNNTFGNPCTNNTFGNSCSNNTFGNTFTHNTFGNSCSNNIFSNNCSINTFSNNCAYNTFGNTCSYNTFGNACRYITFGNSSSSANYYRYNIIDKNCQYLYIDASGIASSSNYLQYVHIHSGVRGTSSTYKTITVDRNLSYETNIVPAGTTTIEV